MGKVLACLTCYQATRRPASARESGRKKPRRKLAKRGGERRLLDEAREEREELERLRAEVEILREKIARLDELSGNSISGEFDFDERRDAVSNVVFVGTAVAATLLELQLQDSALASLHSLVDGGDADVLGMAINFATVAALGGIALAFRKFAPL